MLNSSEGVSEASISQPDAKGASKWTYLGVNMIVLRQTSYWVHMPRTVLHGYASGCKDY